MCFWIFSENRKKKPGMLNVLANVVYRRLKKDGNKSEIFVMKNCESTDENSLCLYAVL